MKETVNTLKGDFAFLGIISNFPGTMVAARKGSPLVIGMGKHEKFVASDPIAFAGMTNQVVFLPEKSFVILTQDTIELYDFAGNTLPINVETLDISLVAIDKIGHDHFMIKEIYEQRQAIHTAVNYYRSLGADISEQLGVSSEDLRNLKKINLFACGTSWHAGCIGRFFFEEITGIPATSHLASEFVHERFFSELDSLYIAISQSGETADTLEALRKIKFNHAPVTAITNVTTSAIARESNGFLPLKAGPEIAVASTKAFTAQITGLYWLANYIALKKGIITPEQMEIAENNLHYAADMLDKVIKDNKQVIVETVAKKYAKATNFMFLGRHIGYPFALEGALKLKEISYIFAQGFAAGELKHGSIALVDEKTPTLIFSHQDPEIYRELISGAQEVKARKGEVIAFVFEGQEELFKIADQAFIIPRVAPLLEPLVMSGLMQFFAYQVAKELGKDIDRPRNLAKSVTVK